MPSNSYYVDAVFKRKTRAFKPVAILLPRNDPRMTEFLLDIFEREDARRRNDELEERKRLLEQRLAELNAQLRELEELKARLEAERNELENRCNVLEERRNNLQRTLDQSASSSSSPSSLENPDKSSCS